MMWWVLVAGYIPRKDRRGSGGGGAPQHNPPPPCAVVCPPPPWPSGHHKAVGVLYFNRRTPWVFVPVCYGRSL